MSIRHPGIVLLLLLVAPFTSSSAQVKIVQGTIVGEIRALAFGNEAPQIRTELARAGWLECAGQSLKRSDFTDLFNVLRTTWGSSDAQNTFFLPDLRGLFLRGWNHSSLPGQPPPLGGDQNPGERLAPRDGIAPPGTPGQSGERVGSLQRDRARVEPHTHSEVRETGTKERASTSPTEQFMHDPREVQTGTPVGEATQFETRPRNAYVMFVIFVGKGVVINENTGEIKPIG